MRNLPILLLAAFVAASSGAAEGLPPAAEILKDTERVADWQLAHLSRIDYIDLYLEETVNPTAWVQGTLFVGLSALADRTGEPRYRDAILDHDRMTGWSLSGKADHADYQLIGQTYFWDYQHTHDAQALTAILQRFDQVLAEHPDVPLDFQIVAPDGSRPCQKRWCWSDALFMAPATWATASRITGDPRYLDYADREMWATVQTLYDPQEHLFYRDSLQMPKRDADGNKIFWSRGNGWVLAGLARFLDALPPDHPSRGRYETLFKEMARRAIQLQTAGGTWSPSLLAGAQGAPPETSGTSLFLFGLAWGVNHGLLDRDATLPALVRGWSALHAAIRPDGRLGWVQKIGYAPDQVGIDDTQLYGTGAMLLAGVELSRLSEGGSTLRNALGMELSVLDYGAALTRVVVPDRRGHMGNVVLGLPDEAAYRKSTSRQGATIGRYAGRIAGAELVIDGTAIHLVPGPRGPTLHSDPDGFDHRLWQGRDFADTDSIGRVFTLHCPDGDQNYPGTLDVQVTYRLMRGSDEFRIEYEARASQPTAINLTNHAYFNLAGAGASGVAAHKLTIPADRYAVTGEYRIPTGELRGVAGSDLDFRAGRVLGDKPAYDDSLFLGAGEGLKPAARIEEPGSGRRLEISTTEPAIQIYTANSFNGSEMGAEGHPYRRNDGVALEPQHLPDSPHHPDFPSTILRPGEVFRSVTVYRFSVME